MIDPDPAPGIRAALDRDRVAELIVTHSNGQRRGSGYLITDRVILTAAHVVTGAVSVRVRLAPDLPAEHTTDGASWWSDADSDLAAVSLTEAASAASPAKFGRLADRAAVLPVQAVGFPRWKMRNADGSVPHSDDRQPKFRDAYHVVGSMAVLSNWREGTLEVVVAAPPAPTDSGSPWEGMSGAPLWVEDRIVGVIARHHPGDGLSRLAAIRIDRALARLASAQLAEFQELVPSIPADPNELPDVVPASVGQLTYDSYRAQLVDVAPDQLRGRDAEIAELVRFCAGDQPVLWWQAPPWTGKTALLSWFALNPPAGQDVVSFFITRRYPGNSNSGAFIRAVSRQLASICNESSAFTTDPFIGDFLRLLHKASGRAKDVGQCLLLIIDGLDEDTSQSEHRDLPSIASLLPSVPLPGVKILISGRPHPDLPVDVSDEHILRSTVPRKLRSSPFAREIEQKALLELERLFTGPRLGRDIAGLVSASGGGLTLSDLEQLTRRPPHQINPLLQSTFGRTFHRQSIGDSRTGDAGAFSFAHETLRTLSEAQLGASISSYRRRILAWADKYRQAGWPADTPTYLLSSYAGILRVAESDWPELLGIAIDQGRHERQFSHSGGDDLARTELADATNVIAKQRPPNYAALIRLAAAEDVLAANTSRIPTRLASAWAALGEFDRAVSLATGISDPEDRSNSMIELVEALLQAGQQGLARHVASLVNAESSLTAIIKEKCLADLVTALSVGGDLHSAEHFLQYIDTQFYRATAVAAFAESLVRNGEIGRAEGLVGQISDLWSLGVALERVVPSIAKVEGIGRAERLLSSIRDPGTRTIALTALASALVEMQAPDRAHRIAETATATFTTIADSAPTRGTALMALLAAYVEIGDPERAEYLLSTTRQTLDYDQAVHKLITALVKAGHYNRVQELLEQLFAVYNPIDTLAAIIPVVAAVGEAGWAERLIQSYGRHKDEEYIGQLVVSLADAGHSAAAVGLLHRVADEYLAQSYASLAPALAVIGDIERAREFAEKATSLTRSGTNHYVYARLVTSLIRSVGSTVDIAQMQKTSDAAIRTVGKIADPAIRNAAMTELVVALAQLSGVERIESLIGGLADPWDRAQVFISLLKRMTEAGKPLAFRRIAVRATISARQIENPSSRDSILFELVQVLSQAGRFRRARRCLDLIRDDWYYALGVASLVKALVKKGKRAEGQRIAERAAMASRAISDLANRARFLGALAPAFCNVGIPRQAEWHIATISDAHARTQALIALLSATADLQDPQYTQRVADLAISSNRQIPDNTFRILDTTDAELAGALAEVGDIARAEALLRQVPPSFRKRGLVKLTLALVRARELRRAKILLGEIDDPLTRNRTLTGIVRCLMDGASRSSERVMRESSGPVLITSTSGLTQQSAISDARFEESQLMDDSLVQILTGDSFLRLTALPLIGQIDPVPLQQLMKDLSDDVLSDDTPSD